jgi:hypothetical protein
MIRNVSMPSGITDALALISGPRDRRLAVVVAAAQRRKR